MNGQTHILFQVHNSAIYKEVGTFAGCGQAPSISSILILSVIPKLVSIVLYERVATALDPTPKLITVSSETGGD